jgi:hypothetical protein
MAKTTGGRNGRPGLPRAGRGRCLSLLERRAGLGELLVRLVHGVVCVEDRLGGGDRALPRLPRSLIRRYGRRPARPSSSMLAGEALERSSSPTDLVRRQVGPWPDERDRALDGEPLDIMEPPRSTSEILLRAWPGRVAFVRDQRRSPILKRHGDRHLDPSGVAERAEPLVDRLPPAGQASSGRLRVSPSRNAVSARRMLASRSSRSSSSGWSTPRSWVQ